MAVTVTVWGDVIEAGAVYRPVLEIDPMSGLSDQETAVVTLPATFAVNCWVSEPANATAVGLMANELPGSRLTVAAADFVGSVALVAVTVIV